MKAQIANFQVFPDSAHQSQLERHQVHIQLDDNFFYHGAHGRSTYGIHDRKWIPHIGIKTLSNCKADTKNSGYQEKIIFDCKIQLEKVQLTRDLKNDTILSQGVCLPCKNNQRYCKPTTRTQATLVWFPDDI